MYVQQLLINGENISYLMSPHGVTLKHEISKVKEQFAKVAAAYQDPLSKWHCEAMVNLIAIWEAGDQSLTNLSE